MGSRYVLIKRANVAHQPSDTPIHRESTFCKQESSSVTYAYARKMFDTPTGGFSYLEINHAGAGAPKVVFSHATSVNAQSYVPILGPTSDRLHLFLLDARGHGKSTVKADPKSLRDWDVYVHDLIKVVEHIGGPVILCGHSVGASVSLATAALRPDLVSGLMLFDPPFMTKYRSIVLGLSKRMGLTRNTGMVKKAQSRQDTFENALALFEQYKNRGMFRGWPDECLKEYIEGGTRLLSDGRVQLTCAPMWESRTYASASHTHWRRLKKVACPIHVFYGGTSYAFSQKAVQQLTAARPTIVMRCVKEAGHFIPMEYPQACREALLELAFPT